MNTSAILSFDANSGMGTIDHAGQMLNIDLGAYTVLDGTDVIGDIDNVTMVDGNPTSVDWSVRIITPADGDADTGAFPDEDAIRDVIEGIEDPMAVLFQQMYGINPEDLTMGGRTVLTLAAAAIPFLGIIGLDAVALNNLFSDDDATRAAALEKVGNSVSNLDTLIETLTPGLQGTSESVADMLGGVVSGLLGRMDASDPTAAFPDIIDGSTGLVRILGEVGKFLSNFDIFAEAMTGETRNGKMTKAFVANLDGLMENALTYIEGALMSKADADALAAAEAAADEAAAEAAAE